MEQLSLFRDYDSHDRTIFNLATKAKLFCQDLYQKADLKADKEQNDYQLIHFNTIITQVRDPSRDVDFRDPETIRFFIRRIRTEYSVNNQEKKPAGDESGKIIDKLSNLVFTESDISAEQFLIFCKQIYGLENARELFENQAKREAFNLKDNKTIVVFNHPLGINSDFAVTSIYSDVLINRIRNNLNKIKIIAEEHGWVIFGYYDDFTQRSDLLEEFDLQEVYKEVSFKEIFATDYMLLNNAEFMTQETNTLNWPLVIPSPKFLINKNYKHNDLGYFYIKIKNDTKFWRFDFMGSNIRLNTLLRICPISINIIENLAGREPHEKDNI